MCRSEFARYQRDKKILELSGMPWVSKGNDVYQGTRITIDLDTEEVNAEGNVQGTIQNVAPSGSASGSASGGTSGSTGGSTSGSTSNGS